MDADAAAWLAGAMFVAEDGAYGCAETTYVVLKRAYGLADPDDPGPAMALNGGVAYEGSMCGAITGAALAVGQLTSGRIADHASAKPVARGIVRGLIDAFAARFGSVGCRELTGYDLRSPEGHDRFMASGVWRTACARQVEFAVRRLAELASDEEWAAAVERWWVDEQEHPGPGTGGPEQPEGEGASGGTEGRR